MGKQEGLGDTIAAFTKATGLDKVAERVAKAAGKEDCGCGKRRETLNRLVPYDVKTPPAQLPRTSGFEIKISENKPE